MQGLAWPLTPVLGQVFKGFAYDGKTWARAKPKLVAEWTNVQVFRASGRYTPSDDLIYAVVECIGPGGGGGWVTSSSSDVSPHPSAAGGGGSGGYSRKTLPAELVIQGADVVIGMGGTVSAGTVGGGKTSGDTSFGGLCVAHGGGNAQAFDGSGTLPCHGIPGNGGLIGIGDFCEPGASGGMWAGITLLITTQNIPAVVPGLGGQLFGGAHWPAYVGTSWIYQSTNGANGDPNTGAGGGGAQVNPANGTAFGGSGGSGLCIVTEICGTENGGGGPGPGPGPDPRPPGVPICVNARVRVTEVPWVPDPNCPHVEPVK